MEFTFDSKKSRLNEEKHGIDFKEAQRLWEDPERLIIPARNLDEPRFLLIGKIDNQYWSAIFTIRKTEIRLISVRRSRKNEKEIYEG
jgi:hypothetical protein